MQAYLARVARRLAQTIHLFDDAKTIISRFSLNKAEIFSGLYAEYIDIVRLVNEYTIGRIRSSSVGYEERCAKLESCLLIRLLAALLAEIDKIIKKYNLVDLTTVFSDNNQRQSLLKYLQDYLDNLNIDDTNNAQTREYIQLAENLLHDLIANIPVMETKKRNIVLVVISAIIDKIIKMVMYVCKF